MKKMTPEEARHYHEYLKAKRVCSRFDISESYLYEQIGLGKFPAPKKFGKLARWSMNDLLDWEVQNGWMPEIPVTEAC